MWEEPHFWEVAAKDKYTEFSNSQMPILTQSPSLQIKLVHIVQLATFSMKWSFKLCVIQCREPCIVN